MSEPFRSAVPLAAAGIVCLGMIPLLDAPERPLHWAMTAGVAGFGALLWARCRLRGPEGPPLVAPQPSAKQAGRTLLLIGGVIAALVGAIVGFRLYSGSAISPLSLVLPAAGLTWLAVLGLQVLGHREAAAESLAASDHPSRRPPQRDLAKPTSTSSHPDQHVSA